MNEQFELEEIKCGDDKNVPQETVIYEINEKFVGPAGENVPCDKIVVPPNMDRYGQERQYYNQGAVQPTFYQQQIVGSQPVYARGYPPAAVSGTPTSLYHYGQVQRDYSVDSFMFTASFNDRAIRNKFIQKVYTILAIQLTYTCGFIALCVFEPGVKNTVLKNPYLAIIAMITFCSTVIILMCCNSIRRSFPMNFILLGILTVAMAYQMGFLSALKSTEIVMSSMAITAGVCFLISIIACHSSLDVTGCGIYLYIIGNVIFMFGIIAIIVTLLTGITIIFLVYAALIALLFSMYLMYDTQMIMGGRRIELSSEEYIFGAITLYLDIIYILWSIMMLFDVCNK